MTNIIIMCKKIKYYKTVVGENRDRLDKVVATYLEQGWIPLGGGYGGSGSLYQTMVVYEDNRKHLLRKPK